MSKAQARTGIFSLVTIAVGGAALIIHTLPSCSSDPTSDWIVHQDAAGFSLKHPPQWHVAVEAKTGIISVSSPQGEEAYYLASGSRLTFTAGEVTFTCTRNGEPYRGYFMASTTWIDASRYGANFWFVQGLFGYLAPESRTREAYDVLEHAVLSFQYNPAWVEKQSDLAVKTSQIATKTAHSISDTIRSSYEGRQRTLDELSRRRSNATLGVYDVVDNLTGTNYRVESSSNYYWIDQHGTIIGTQTDSRPSVDFRSLVRLP